LKKSAAEQAFAVFAVGLSTGAVIDVWLVERGIDTRSTDGELLPQVIWGCVYAITIALLAKRFRGVWLACKENPTIPLLALLAFASTLWSDVPALTLRRSVALIGTTLLGIYVGLRYTTKEQLEIYGRVSATVIVLSLATALLLPDYGVMITMDGAWRGVFVHKNVLARMMVLGAIVLWFESVLIQQRSRRWSRRLAAAAALAVLFCSHSVTGMAVAFVVVASVWLCHVATLRTRNSIAFLASGVLAGTALLLLVATNLTTVLDFWGRDTTLTGRTILWGYVASSILDRLALGAGYSAFWAGPSGEAVQSAIGRVFVHAHNGYLDLALDLGATGLTLFLVTLALIARRAIRVRDTHLRSEKLWTIAVIVFTVSYNMTESAILTRNSVFWVILVASATSVSFPGARSKRCPDKPSTRLGTVRACVSQRGQRARKSTEIHI
jgi:O-antigen ligase